MHALLELRHRQVFPTDAATELFKDPFLPCFPVALLPLLQHAVELLLRLLPALLDG